VTRRPKKRTVLILAVLLLLSGITVVVWEVADWPPPRLILKYGFPPTGGPTGRTKTIEGIEFVELKPGYCWVEACKLGCTDGNLLGRISALIGLKFGRPVRHMRRRCRYWHELSQPVWITPHEQEIETHLRLNVEIIRGEKRLLESRAGPILRFAREGEESYLFQAVETPWAGFDAWTYVDGEPYPLTARLVWIPPEDE
jgi:hypothetical protein